jgi:hypothetical protein
MTEQPITPPPHLLKQFSEQARVDSSKRGGSGYLKTFARFCIEWAMGQLDAKPTPNPLPIRSSEITPPPELVEQWVQATESNDCIGAFPTNFEKRICIAAARWGADQELEACCEWMKQGWDDVRADKLRATRRPKPKPPSKEEALDELYISFDRGYLIKEAADTIRRALEQLDD